ncbi:MAG: prepilin peptidase, partial [Mesorhizobium sp.]
MLLGASLLLKALAIPLLARIAWVDFTTQKITNRDVLLLLCLGLGSLQLLSVQSGSWWDMGLSALAGLLLFIVLFPFWTLRRVGAGDVKLMAVIPLLIGGSGLVVFSVLLLLFALVMAMVVKNPLMLPQGAFQL